MLQGLRTHKASTTQNVAPFKRKRQPEATLYESSSEDEESIPFLASSAQRGTLDVRLAPACGSDTTKNKGKPPKKKAKRSEYELDASSRTEDITEERSRTVGVVGRTDTGMVHDGEQMDVTSETEDLLASVDGALIGTEDAEGPVFNRNFLNSVILKQYPPKTSAKVVKSELRDFPPMLRYFREQRKPKKPFIDAEKDGAQDRRTPIEDPCSISLLKGPYGNVLNCCVEPLGPARDRGGKPEDDPKLGSSPTVMLDMGQNASIAMERKQAVHDETLTWLGSWIKKLNENRKHALLNDPCGAQSD
ncbi:hypothetical protein LXA43DRAFT_1103984 [Ganoderma leucocontextum]|nr:hypothetical protein LXA43DRAFT_1103984 [Ganoderma leucocontextum]